MKIKKGAWAAFYRGTTSKKLKESAKDKSDLCLFWLVATLALAYYAGWEWAIFPAILAAVNGSQWLDQSRLAPEIEVLENLLEKRTSRG